MAQSDDFFGTSLTYEQIQELLPGFALGALDVHEMQAVEHYLQQHEQLLQSRYTLELSSQALAYSAPSRPLPASIKARMMERVRADAQGVRRVSLALNPPVTPIQARAISRPQRRGALPIFPAQPRPQSTWRGVYQGLVGLAALAATAIVLLANLQLNRQIDTTQAQLAVAQTQLQQTQTAFDSAQTQTQQTSAQVALIQAQLQQVQRDAAELKTANTALRQTLDQQTNELDLLSTANRLLTLAGQGLAEQAQGTFIVSNNQVILTVRGLSPLPTNKTYQLWYIPEGGDPEPADLFAVNAGDATRFKFAVPAETIFAKIGITIEPAGGSLTPTELVLLSTT